MATWTHMQSRIAFEFLKSESTFVLWKMKSINPHEKI